MYSLDAQHVHMTEVTLTALRKDLFRLVDSVLETGEPLVIRRGGRRLTLVAEAVERKMTPEERWDAYMAQGVREGADDWADDIDTNKSHWTWDPDAKFDFGDK
jgi:PHD/YefM family antitoxin component YafN of YafNO toxin-antitoxin module